jgi:hypothetical protein
VGAVRVLADEKGGRGELSMGRRRGLSTGRKMNYLTLRKECYDTVGADKP